MNPKLFISLLLSIGVAGIFVYMVGKWGMLTPLAAQIIVAALFLRAISLLRQFSPRILGFSNLEKVFIFILFLQFNLNFIGLLVPETAFDALWYHLPEAQVYQSTGHIQKIPELLYSTMPRLGEMYLTLAMFAHSFVVVKLISFLACILYLVACYLVSRLFLSRPLSLLVMVIVNSFPLVAWQSASAYIDLPRAVFELGSIYCLVQFFKLKQPTWFLNSALLTGFALSIKMQSFIHLFATIVVVLYFSKSIKLVACFLLLVALVTSPWYLDNFLSSGHPLYPLNLPSKQIDQLQHAGTNSPSVWISHQLLRLPLLPVELGLNPREQLSPIIMFLLPLLIWQFKSVVQKLFPLIPYLFITLVLWYFIPPPESRYLLGSLPILIILLIYSVISLPEKYMALKSLSLVACFLSLLLTFSIRLAASYKYLPLLTGQITPKQYLNSQTTDFNRDIMTKYYSGYWLKYHY